LATEQTEETQFEDSPQGWARRWTVELNAARRRLEKWHVQAEKILRRFLDERDAAREGDTRWNLFTSNQQTLGAMLYGQTPAVSVGRRFADANDDEARVAGEMLERLLNCDIEREDDGYATALQLCLNDRLLVGLGNARVRYVAQMETVPEVPAIMSPDGFELAPAVPATERKAFEDVETDYVHWKDQLWGAGRVFHEVPWWAFRVEMSREKLVERFGEEVGRVIPLNAARGRQDDKESASPWARAEVWEIWDKESRKVFWFVEGYPSTLDIQDDPYGLAGFFPFPRPMVSNLTTSKFLPRPDFVLAQDLYNEVDAVSTRITLLERAVRVVGAYNQANGELRRIISEANQNEMIPVENWALFGEGGGIRGQVDWFPLEQVVAALSALRDYRAELVEALFQITGMSDIMRGQGARVATATEQSIKAKFGSVRVQAMQDEFARFASDLQKLRAELIASHFDAETILAKSNAANTFDAQVAPRAAELLKSGLSQYRVEVKPEAVSLTDFAARKQERMEVLAGLSNFLSAAAPLAQQSPASLPYLLQMLQWAISGLKGASQIEGVLDQAISAAQQAAAQAAQQPQQQQQDPKIQALHLKGQLEMKKEEAKLQTEVAKTQMAIHANEEKERAQAKWNTQEKLIQHRLDQQRQAEQRGFGPGGLP
jgi:hypothetical protein